MRTPVVIVSGFLGSGKTTLINRWIGAGTLADTGIIVNEFGAVGIDHLLYEAGAGATVLLGNGCVCCALQSDLPDALRRLEQRRQDAGGAPFERIVLETSGLADPAPVIMSLLSDPALAGRCRLDAIVVTADACHLPAALAQAPEAAAQLALADRIVLTKADLASAAELAGARAELAALNPAAPVLMPDAPVADVFGAGLHDAARDRWQAAAWLGGDALGRPRVAHASGVGHFTLELAPGLRWQVLEEWLRALLALAGERILRVKGIVQPIDIGHAVAVHAVHHQLHGAVALPPGSVPDPRSLLVFITRGLDRDAVLESLRGWGIESAPAAVAPAIA